MWINILLLCIWLLILIFNILLLKFIYIKEKIKKSILNNTKYINLDAIYFDGLPLFYEPVSSSNFNKIISKKVNCNSFIIKCETDRECKKYCIPVKFKNVKTIPICSLKSNSTCAYEYLDKSLGDIMLKCLNGGTPIPHIIPGKLFSCACPSNFIGRYCEVPNLLKPSNHKSFSLQI